MPLPLAPLRELPRRTRMTLVVCPNLAIDRMLAADAVRPGGMTRCRALRTQAGGKGSNVMRALRALDGSLRDVRTTAPLLTGFTAGRGGRLIVELAADEEIWLEPVVTGGEARVSTVVLGDDGSVTRLYEHGPKAGIEDERALAEVVRARPAGAGEWAVITGAAPPGVSPGFYAALVRAARAVGYRVLLDATDEQITAALEEGPDLVKVNLAEACFAVGRSDADCDDEKSASREALVAEGLGFCRRLVKAGAGDAVVTLGAAGAVGLLDGHEWQVNTRPIVAVNPVGSGDCFAAGLVLAFERGDDSGDALALAAGAAAANATSPFNGTVDPTLAFELAGGADAGPPRA